MAQQRYSDISDDIPIADTRVSQEEDPFLGPFDGHPTKDVHLATLSEKKRLWWRNAAINILFILSWFSFATILSVYNKWMFSPTRYAFPAPLFVTTMHMFVQFTLAAFLRFAWPSYFRPERTPTYKDYGKRAVPTAVATSLDIGLSNLSLKTITLSFYTMCKSSSLIFVLLFAFLFRLEVFLWRLVAVIFLIFSGVLLMVATETEFSLDGFLLDKHMGFDNPAATIYYLSPGMGVTLAIVSATTESWATLFRSQFFSGSTKILETSFFLSAPGVVAFCMVLSEFYIIQRVGIVPMSIAGIAKEVATISISSQVFGDKLTPLNIVGVAITVCGIGLFTYHKYRKSLESDVPLDAHGNPVTDEEDAGDYTGEANGRVAAEEEGRHLSCEEIQDEFGETMSREGEPQVLFSADDGEEDADELRSLRSSKMQWEGNGRDKERSERVDEASGSVARESMELERMWAREDT